MKETLKLMRFYFLGFVALSAILATPAHADEAADERFERNLEALIEARRQDVAPVSDAHFAGSSSSRLQSRVKGLQGERKSFGSVNLGAKTTPPKAKPQPNKKKKKGRYGKGKKKRK